ncbi:hypothetical protein BB561_003255 [Smittium simulii]|uniref:Expansin-like EG45 domain-containing protein n=1 Tax=Smittium simulii TaxID=133385 RepID=A0A2T9YMF1_9FUNG|nr:hypothetical protein BB561_003255 [Smittium simulii]
MYIISRLQIILAASVIAQTLATPQQPGPINGNLGAKPNGSRRVTGPATMTVVKGFPEITKRFDPGSDKPIYKRQLEDFIAKNGPIITTEFHKDYDPTFSTSKVYTGDGTYYDPGVGIGACGNLNNNDQAVVAMNTFQYGATPNPNNAPICGKCVKITATGPGANKNVSVIAKVVDRCPVCKFGDVDMSESVFLKISPLAKGRIPISWSFVNC